MRRPIGDAARRTIAAAALVLGAAGCGDDVSLSSDTTEQPAPRLLAEPDAERKVPAAPPARVDDDDRRLANAVPFDDGIGARLDPPPPGPLKVVPSMYVEDTLRIAGPTPIGGPTAPHATFLASYTNTVYGEIQEDGSVLPTYTERLVWATVFQEVPPTVRGGRTADGRPAANAVHNDIGTCTFVVLSDATTGDYLMAFEDCSTEPVGLPADT